MKLNITLLRDGLPLFLGVTSLVAPDESLAFLRHLGVLAGVLTFLDTNFAFRTYHNKLIISLNQYM